MRRSVQKVVPSHHYESDIYQSVEIYQIKNRFLSWYYWGRVTTAVGMLLDTLENTRGGHALDLGCGSGMTLPTLQKCFVEVTAADVYTEHARRVIELEGLEGVNLFASDGGALPFEDESFDQVLLFDLLEHVEGNKGQVIDECWRVLRRGGYVACSFPVEVGPVVFLRQVGRRLFGLEGNRQGVVETLAHAVGVGRPPTRGRSEEVAGTDPHDNAHRGYNYKLDLVDLKRRFESVSTHPVPFRHIGFLSPAYVFIGRKPPS